MKKITQKRGVLVNFLMKRSRNERDGRNENGDGIPDPKCFFDELLRKTSRIARRLNFFETHYDLHIGILRCDWYCGVQVYEYPKVPNPRNPFEHYNVQHNKRETYHIKCTESEGWYCAHPDKDPIPPNGSNKVFFGENNLIMPKLLSDIYQKIIKK